MVEQIPFNDNRLERKIDDFYVVDKSMISSLSRLSEKSKIKFTCKDEDVGSYSVCCRIKNKKLFEIMNGICLIRNFSWNKIDKGFQLDDSLNEYDRVFKARNEFEKERNELALPLMDLMDKLSNRELQAIESPQGIFANEFSPSMQKNIQGIIETINQEDKTGITKNLREVRIQMDRQKSPGFKNYIIFIKTSQGNFGRGIYDYERWKAKLMNKSDDLHYENTKKPLKKSQWGKSDLSKTNVSFSGYASPAEIFLEIASKHDFDFISDRKKFWKQSKNVNYKDLSIPEFLERIERDFPNTKCDISDDEIVVVQAPMNPWRIYSAQSRS
jgi:hypothetical protein